MMVVSADAHNNRERAQISMEPVVGCNIESLRAIKNDQTKAKLCLAVR